LDNKSRVLQQIWNALQFLHDLLQIRALKKLLLHHMKNRKRYAEEHFLAFEKKEIPKSDHNIEVEVVAKQASEPLQTAHLNLEKYCFEVSM
jgi:hypothetical protein